MRVAIGRGPAYAPLGGQGKCRKRREGSVGFGRGCCPGNLGGSPAQIQVKNSTYTIVDWQRNSACEQRQCTAGTVARPTVPPMHGTTTETTIIQYVVIIDGQPTSLCSDDATILRIDNSAAIRQAGWLWRRQQHSLASGGAHVVTTSRASDLPL